MFIKKDPQDRQVETIVVRVTQRDLERCNAHATRAGLNRSAYILRLLHRAWDLQEKRDKREGRTGE